MTGLDDLRDRVRTAYGLLAAPSWRDPHPGGASPAQDEYSRVSDTARYRITRLRAEVWTEALAGLPDVTLEELSRFVRAEPGLTSGSIGGSG